MRKWTSLAEVPYVHTRAVIINCGTKWLTSLALLSALQRTPFAVLLINCPPEDGSREHFASLAVNLGLEFDWIDWPLRPHPVALDHLFDEIAAARVLLIDSDLEILSDELAAMMSRRLDADERAYGVGFRHGPSWIGEERGMHAFAGYYVERMWIPFVMLSVPIVRNALREGLSFGNKRPHTDIPQFPVLARLLGYRYRIRGLRKIRFPLPGAVLDPDALEAGVPQYPRPAFIEFDTGAKLHCALSGSGHPFIALADGYWGQVHHYHGVTRAQLSSRFRRLLKRFRLASTDTEVTQEQVMRRVRSRLASLEADRGGSPPPTPRYGQTFEVTARKPLAPNGRRCYRRSSTIAKSCSPRPHR